MLRLIAYRAALAVPQLLIIGTLAFLLTYLIPGSAAAAMLGNAANPEAVARLESQLGLDRPFFERLVSWFAGALQGDLGTSYSSGIPVTDLLLQRLPATLSLVAGGLVVAVILGIGLGMLAGVRAGRPVDRGVTGFTSVSLAVPEFWLGLLLVLVFVAHLRWLPVVSYVSIAEDPLLWARGLILPSLALGVGTAALIARQGRGAIAEALSSRYVDTLRAIGIPRLRIVWGFAFKNAMVPILAALGLTTSVLFGTSLIMERVFAFPGIGSLLITSVIGKDFPVVQGGAILLGGIIIVINLLVDIGYGLLNPKARPA